MSTLEKDIFECLIERGCCKLCALRYLCNKNLDFEDVDAYLIKNDFIKNDVSSESNTEVRIKKSKTNPCIVCIGLLQDYSVTDILQFPDLGEANAYDSPVFTCSISVPATILVREHSMRLYVQDKFPSFYTDGDNIEIPLNRVWKMFIRKRLGEHIQKTFENSDVCNFSINITMDYALDSKELEVLTKMQPKIFEQRKVQRRKFNGELFSRKGVINALSVTSSGVFKMHAPVPPEIPDLFLYCKKIECKHSPLYVAGRYCKYSRKLSQSPWIIDGVKLMETSVQEIIFEKFLEVLGVPGNNLKFSSSGREDCDVRCLGKGRPFYIEIMDPKKTRYISEDFRKLETCINSSPLIKVSDLQTVPRADLVYIKEGEDSKTKDYNALCFVKEAITEAQIDKLNTCCPLIIEQPTPIRVLHRRPLSVRSRTIYEMKAKLVAERPHLMELYMRTQAGTYVKEFVHGDFGRTKPSVGNIIEGEADILALDVIAINLDWPKEVSGETETKVF